MSAAEEENDESFIEGSKNKIKPWLCLLRAWESWRLFVITRRPHDAKSTEGVVLGDGMWTAQKASLGLIASARGERIFASTGTSLVHHFQVEKSTPPIKKSFGG